MWEAQNWTHYLLCDLTYCQLQGNDHCPGPDGHTTLDTGQCATDVLCHMGTLQAHGQTAVNPFCWAALKPLSPKPLALHCPRAGPITLHCWPPYLWPWYINPDLSAASQPPSRSTLLLNSVFSLGNRQRVHLTPSPSSSIKILNWTHSSQYWALGNSTGDQLPHGFNSTHHHTGPSHSASFPPSKECTHSSHEQSVCSAECCGVQSTPMHLSKKKPTKHIHIKKTVYSRTQVQFLAKEAWKQNKVS